MVSWYVLRGPPMYWIAGAGTLMFALCYLHIRYRRWWSLLGGLLLSPIPPIAGFVGMHHGQGLVAHAIQTAPPQVRAELLTMGIRESRHGLYVGIMVTALAVTLLMYGQLRRRPAQTSAA